MDEQRFWTHEAIVDHLQLVDDDTLLDLGCGIGHTLLTAARRPAPVQLVGIDIDKQALAVADSRLSSIGATTRLVHADLSHRLPIRARSVTKVACHDVLEWLVDPSALLVEATRVMREDALSVWSHTDYDSTVIQGADQDLTRRVVHAYSDSAETCAGHSDGQMGRKLVGIVRRSPLEMIDVDAYVLRRTGLSGPAKLRIDNMVTVLRRAAAGDEVNLTLEELERWRASIVAADKHGDFFYAQTAYMVVAKKTRA
ncbi:MAG: methyltransferase domain-containing protein [Actinomycetota bacterium]|nr:methyltransferase domain-containing protein [Actinomycetota bacterium]